VQEQLQLLRCSRTLQYLGSHEAQTTGNLRDKQRVHLNGRQLPSLTLGLLRRPRDDVRDDSTY